MGTFFRIHFVVSYLLFQYFSVAYSTTLTITNNCKDIIWPVVWPSPGAAVPSGFALFPGQSQPLTVGPTWSGRVWARTYCSSLPTGKFLCATGDCGTGAVDCTSSSSSVEPSPPATMVEFTPYAYSVSVVNGYNLPVLVVPKAGGGGSPCTTVGCAIDYGGVYYPPELRASYGNGSQVAGLKSACAAFNAAEYCCSGSYSSASSCVANTYSQLFKKWCPQARTYAYDGTGTTFTCQFADFVVNFCSPSSNGGTGNSGIANPDDDDSNDFGKNQVDYKFVAAIAVVVALLGIFSIWYIWRKCFRNDCETCTVSCCSLFSCSCCLGDDHHHHSGKC